MVTLNRFKNEHCSERVKLFPLGHYSYSRFSCTSLSFLYFQFFLFNFSILRINYFKKYLSLKYIMKEICKNL